MSTPRDAFLQRVRDAVTAGNRPGESAAVPPRGGTGYQGAGPDPAARFCQELTAAGGVPHPVADEAAAVEKVLALVAERAARRVLLGQEPVIDRLDLENRLRQRHVEVSRAEAADREAIFAADLGITGVDYLIAETGSLAVLTRPGVPRATSLLPPVHVAVAHCRQLLPDLFDLFEQPALAHDMPSCLTLITGPSKTGDIELRLVTGVHGPGEVHVILIGG